MKISNESNGVLFCKPMSHVETCKKEAKVTISSVNKSGCDSLQADFVTLIRCHCDS